MKQFFLFALALMPVLASAQEQKVTIIRDTVFVTKTVVVNQNGEVIPTTDATVAPAVDETPATVEKNNWGAKLKASPFGLGVDLQTKYMWRGIEMMVEDACPVVFPSINFSYEGLYIYAMGGYAFNGKYSELDLGISYTWKGLTVGFNDYFYPSTYEAYDKYFTGGKESKHWLEACVTYAPEKVPLWVTVSNFFYSPTDVYVNDKGEEKKAYSTYIELGTYYDFLKSNRISLALGMTPYASWYNDYKQKFSVCNIDLKYTYNISFKNTEWTLPLSAELIYNPVFEKPYFNLIANFAF